MNDHNVQETWEGDNNVLIQQASKFVLECAKSIFRGKELKTYTLKDWLTINPVNEEKFGSDITHQSLIKALQQ